MAVAWSKGKIGHGTADVTVRDPVVLTATLPRFLLPGDRSSVHLDLDNVEGRGRRLHHRRDQRRRAFGRVERRSWPCARKSAAPPTCRSPPRRPATAPSGSASAGRAALPGSAVMRSPCARPDADAGAPDDQAAGQRRKPHGVERHVRRSRARHRRGVAFDRLAGVVRCGGACSPRSTAIRSAARSRSRAGRCRFSISAIWPRIRRSRPIRPRIRRCARRSRRC